MTESLELLKAVESLGECAKSLEQHGYDLKLLNDYSQGIKKSLGGVRESIESVRSVEKLLQEMDVGELNKLGNGLAARTAETRETLVEFGRILTERVEAIEKSMRSLDQWHSSFNSSVAGFAEENKAFGQILAGLRSVIADTDRAIKEMKEVEDFVGKQRGIDKLGTHAKGLSKAVDRLADDASSLQTTFSRAESRIEKLGRDLEQLKKTTVENLQVQSQKTIVMIEAVNMIGSGVEDFRKRMEESGSVIGKLKSVLFEMNALGIPRSLRIISFLFVAGITIQVAIIIILIIK